MISYLNCYLFEIIERNYKGKANSAKICTLTLVNDVSYVPNAGKIQAGAGL